MRLAPSRFGSGFVQVQLQGNQRLHVWHPELPRRTCFEHSAIHNHRFDFDSLILVGEKINIEYADLPPTSAAFIRETHGLYLHEGARTARGGRPWVTNGRVDMRQAHRRVIPAGSTYRMKAYDFHRTEPGGDFDRFQWSPAQLWEVVSDVLLGQKVTP